jgi:hypothetical protein
VVLVRKRLPTMQLARACSVPRRSSCGACWDSDHRSERSIKLDVVQLYVLFDCVQFRKREDCVKWKEWAFRPGLLRVAHLTLLVISSLLLSYIARFWTEATSSGFHKANRNELVVCGSIIYTVSLKPGNC